MLSWLIRRDAEPEHPRAGGRPARAPAGERVYAVGDVHGRLDQLLDIERRIAEDVAARPPPGRVSRIYLGDYVDRGPDSREVLDHLAQLARADDTIVFLIGNHDWWLQDFLVSGAPSIAWLGAGGDATLASYGVHDMPAFDDSDAWSQVSVRLRRRVPAEHQRFLRQLRTLERRGDYVFVHAGIRPGLPLEQQDAGDLIFIREPFLSDRSDLGFVVVHGHTIVEEPQVRRNRIGIDTGACWTGRLTAVVLEEDNLRFLHTGE